ncbi:hypothetical protein DPMN_159937 [Dreissena polymorpha]|uniref:Uncharacterized protein n=1 Tax=Dreissena polymorpha TaxID=45954 RepID=A0A9D4ELW3_DREPO|nr:hypothetical protein DPMN_159937 [Dreissena polymorpha]
MQTNFENVDYEALNKSTNLLQYKNAKKLNVLGRLKKKISGKHEQLNAIEKKIGHFSVRNVNKRDRRAVKNVMLLHKSESSKTLLTRKVQRLTAKSTCLTKEVNDLKVCLTELQKQNETMETKYDDLLGRCNIEKDKKL